MFRNIFLLFTLLTSSLQANTVLVAGGAGFIGSNLCENLINEGHNVICVDNLSTSSADNLRAIIDHPSFQFICQDICHSLNIEQKIDEIYNMACPASPPLYQKDPIHTLHTSFNGVDNLLRLAKKHNAKFLQSSTSEVYGNPLEHPQSESYWGNVNPNGPRSCYDEGKRVAETLILAYQQQHDVDVKIVRIFNTYGPKMSAHDGRVTPNFITQALENKPITIYGSGEQTRSFCYVDDLVDGLKKMMATKKGYTGPVNLGNPQEMTIKELAYFIKELIGSASEISFLSLPQDDPQRRKPNIQKAQKELGWSPKVYPREGFEKTIAYFSESIRESE